MQINDWGVVFGFDSSKVDKGLKDMEAKFKSFSNRINNVKIRPNFIQTTPGSPLVKNPAAKTSKAGLMNDMQRLKVNQQIERAIAKAERSMQIQTDGSQAAITAKASLKRQVDSLRASQQQLVGITNRNSAGYLQVQTSMGRAGMETTALTHKLRSLRTAQHGVTSSTNGMHAALSKLGGPLGASAAGLVAVGFAAFRDAKQLDSLKASFLAATGGAESANAELNFVRASADKLGTNLFAAARGYQQVGTAARAAGMDQQTTRNLFLGASEAATAFGLSVDDTHGVFRAFSQILSKGTVQAEELRSQLGDRLPGAFNLYADSMGVSTDQLNKMLKAGQVASTTLIPFVELLRKTAKESGALAAGMNSITASQERATNQRIKLGEAFTDAGGKSAIAGFFGVLGDVFKLLTPIAKVLGAILKPFMGALKLASGLITKFFGPISGYIGDIADRISSIGFESDLMNGSLAQTGMSLETAIANASELDKWFRRINATLRLMGAYWEKFSDWAIDVAIPDSIQKLLDIFLGGNNDSSGNGANDGIMSRMKAWSNESPIQKNDGPTFGAMGDSMVGWWEGVMARMANTSHAGYAPGQLDGGINGGVLEVKLDITGTANDIDQAAAKVAEHVADKLKIPQSVINR